MLLCFISQPEVIQIECIAFVLRIVQLIAIEYCTLYMMLLTDLGI